MFDTPEGRIIPIKKQDVQGQYSPPIEEEFLSLDDPIENLNILHKNAERVGMQVFKWNDWFVVARKADEVSSNAATLTQIDKFQDTIDPKQLRGKCVYVHEIAELTGFADATMAAGRKDKSSHPSIYPPRVPHRIGVKDKLWNSIYFDLTARVYVLTEKDNLDESLGKGIIVIDRRWQKKGIEALYDCTWERVRLDKNPNSRESLRWYYNRMKVDQPSEPTPSSNEP